MEPLEILKDMQNGSGALIMLQVQILPAPVLPKSLA